MSIYIKINSSEIQNARKNTIALQNSFSKLEIMKSKYRILKREKNERIFGIKDNLEQIKILMEKIEKELPIIENPYVKTELTSKGISISPILELKKERDYLKEFREINKNLMERKK